MALRGDRGKEVVDVRIIVEGGVLKHPNNSAATMNNSEKHRKSFHKLLAKLVPENSFNLIVKNGAGVKNAVKMFQRNENSSLLIDLDGDKSTKPEKLTELEITENSKAVFFMIREMEAWILSQPEVIELCFTRNDKSFEDESIFTIHPENIEKPSERLKVFLRRYYIEKKGNNIKKKQYGKLKDAPLMIEKLDPKKLERVFEDLLLLKNYILKSVH